MRLVLDWILDYIDHRNTHWRSIIGLIMVMISLREAAPPFWGTQTTGGGRSCARVRPVDARRLLFLARFTPTEPLAS